MPTHTPHESGDGTVVCTHPTGVTRAVPIDNPDGSASCSFCGAIVATRVLEVAA